MVNMIETLAAAINGSRRVRFVFREDGYDATLALNCMQIAGMVELSEAETAALERTQDQTEWGEQSRQFDITLTPSFDSRWFMEELRPACQSITAIN